MSHVVGTVPSGNAFLSTMSSRGQDHVAEQLPRLARAADVGDPFQLRVRDARALPSPVLHRVERAEDRAQIPVAHVVRGR